MRGDLTDREAAEADFQAQFNGRGWFPRFAAWFHGWSAIGWCFFLGWPTTFVEWGGVPLLGCALVRLIWTWRLYKHWLVQPLVMVGGSFFVWQGVSTLWTPDPATALEQAGQARWLWAPLALWPVMHRRRAFIVALAIGLMCGVVSQAAHAVGTTWGIDTLRFDRAPDRNSGWWKPVVGGTLLVAALGLHLPAALRGIGRARWAGVAGSVITLVAIFATGTRGAWIASGVLLVFAVLAAVVLTRNKRRAYGALFAGVVVVLVAGVVARPYVLPGMQRRYEAAKNEVRAALERGDYQSDTGARLGMAIWAYQAFRAHPIIGVGAGGYRAWVEQESRRSAISGAAGASARTGASVHAHAHNTVLHTAATTGLIGLALLAGTMLIALRNAAAFAKDGGGGYAAGPFYALAGLIAVSPFDSVPINAQTAALFITLLGVCPSWTPRARAVGGSAGAA